jgi:hypothetical protein
MPDFMREHVAEEHLWPYASLFRHVLNFGRED